MASNESHAVRNGVIITAVGGLVLSATAPMRESVLGALKWLWSGVIWVWGVLSADYSLPGWVLLIIGILALVGIVKIYLAFRPLNDPKYKSYTQDSLYGANWRWSWASNNISNLWCFCPHCDAEVIYDDSFCSRITSNICKTYFICEKCGNKDVASIDGNLKYALEAVKREIRRRIRTNEYANSSN
jgi:hypothetical protein